MFRRLSLRIALLILVGIPLNFFLFMNINYVAVRVLGVPEDGPAAAVQVALLFVSTPLLQLRRLPAVSGGGPGTHWCAALTRPLKRPLRLNREERIVDRQLLAGGDVSSSDKGDLVGQPQV